MDKPSPTPSSLVTPPLPPQACAPRATPGSAPRRLQSRDLLGQDRELEIEHAGQLYRLRLTQLGKLILTK
ncbi:hemin uptake protein HemP [Roseateles sp. DB2]|uniref:hemin uptake protein HemP n=1 Tax=Roseateles sp. DB2 TaxID=3453717 RepID=UPI003EF00B0D